LPVSAQTSVSAATMGRTSPTPPVSALEIGADGERLAFVGSLDMQTLADAERSLRQQKVRAIDVGNRPSPPRLA